MSIAFTFPGQGSQTVGMGKELADTFPEARAVFEEVDEALGQNLSTIIWEGPIEELTLTSNAQPALMAVSLAAVRALQASGFDLPERVSFVAGHSLGEYSALAAAGTFSVADAARLLRTRGDAMQAAVPVGEGAMAAIIGLEEADVDAICGSVSKDGGSCQIANDNGGAQLVVSGSRQAVEAAAAAAQQKGAKRAMLLPVSAPFHSTLMQPAADIMRSALDEVTLRTPLVPLIANVLAAPVSDPREIADLLVRQVTGRVRWRETIVWLAENGVTEVYEVGAGKVLTGLARRIDRSVTGKAINSPQDIEAIMNG